MERRRKEKGGREKESGQGRRKDEEGRRRDGNVEKEQMRETIGRKGIKRREID